MRRMRIVVATGEFERRFARGGDERCERDTDRLTRGDAHSRPQCKDRIEYGTGRAGKCAVRLHGAGIVNGETAANEARAIGFTGDFCRAIPSCVDHMDAPQLRIVRRPLPACRGDRGTPLVPFGLYKQVRECGVCPVCISTRHDDLAVARQFNFVREIPRVRQRDATNFCGIGGNDGNLRLGFDIAVSALQRDSIRCEPRATPCCRRGDGLLRR